MRIAVASEDGLSVSGHFGRSRCFLVFEVEGDQIVGSSARANTATVHPVGGCRETGAHDHHHGHDHEALLAALRGCQVVLARGLGWRAAEALKEDGIEAFLVPDLGSPEEAVMAFLTGQVGRAVEFCRGSR